MGTEKEEPDCRKQFEAAVSVIQNLPKNGEPVGTSILGFRMVGLRPCDETGPVPCKCLQTSSSLGCGGVSSASCLRCYG